MHDLSDFYEKLDLKYNEIAIALDAIDRLNPGRIRFSIPILTPGLDSTSILSKRIYQNKSNLQNIDKGTVEVNNLVYTNYITLSVPKEVCGIIYCEDPNALPDSTRYIPKGSKWIVSFIGGDITKPKIIAKYE